jgi:cell wall assembly regulator SMI1
MKLVLGMLGGRGENLCHCWEHITVAGKVSKKEGGPPQSFPPGFPGSPWWPLLTETNKKPPGKG